MLVLETDQTFEETAERKGSFGQIFHELFSKAGQDHDPPLEIETLMKFIVEPEGGKLPTAEEVGEVDAVLITGSNYDAHGDDEWILKLIERIRSMFILSLQSVIANEGQRCGRKSQTFDFLGFASVTKSFAVLWVQQSNHQRVRSGSFPTRESNSVLSEKHCSGQKVPLISIKCMSIM